MPAAPVSRSTRTSRRCRSTPTLLLHNWWPTAPGPKREELISSISGPLLPRRRRLERTYRLVAFVPGGEAAAFSVALSCAFVPCGGTATGIFVGSNKAGDHSRHGSAALATRYDKLAANRLTSPGLHRYAYGCALMSTGLGPI